MKPHYNKNLDEIINALDGSNRADAPPYLMTRINAALQMRPAEYSVWNNLASMLRKPAIAFIILAAILFLNVLVINGTDQSADRDAVASATIASKDDIAVNAVASYDFENQVP